MVEKSKTKKALMIHEQDNVATVINYMESGESLEIMKKDGSVFEAKIYDTIPFGHKVSLFEIREGEEVKKYGEPIGIAKKDISKGMHVHINNLKSNRARSE